MTKESDLNNIENARKWLEEIQGKPISEINMLEYQMFTWLNAFNNVLKNTEKELLGWKREWEDKQAKEDLGRSW